MVLIAKGCIASQGLTYLGIRILSHSIYLFVPLSTGTTKKNDAILSVVSKAMVGYRIWDLKLSTSPKYNAKHLLS